jgi:hypothetical protein
VPLLPATAVITVVVALAVAATVRKA